MKHTYLITLALLISVCMSDLVAQIGFHRLLADDVEEPNISHFLSEYEDKYIVGGKYFDQSIGRWTVFFALYDRKGNYLKKHTMQRDTVFADSEVPHMLEDNDGFYFGASVGQYYKMVMYDKLQDSIRIKLSYNARDLDFLEWGHTFNLTNSILFSSGRSIGSNDINGIASIMRRDSLGNTQFYRHDIGASNLQTAFSISSNSRGELVASCYDVSSNSLDKAQTFFIILDEDLNVLHNTWDSPNQTNLLLTHGLVIDQSDNILVTGIQFENNDYIPSIPTLARFSPEGNLIWKKQIGQKNSSGYGRWHSVIESKEKDGYIVVGSEVKEGYDIDADSTIVRAAITKLGYNGDVHWERTYSFRGSATTVIESFSDVILSSDGHYVASGSSRNNSSSGNLPWIQTLLVKMNDQGIYDPNGISSIELGVDENNKVVHLYPNPTIDKLYITQSVGKPLRGRIINISGQVVSRFLSDGHNHTHVLDVSDFDSGSYHLIAEDETGQQYVKTFIVTE